MPDLIQGFNTPLPGDVPGYQEAAAAGTVPIVPQAAPQLLPGATSAQFIRQRIIVFLVAFVAAVVIGRIFQTGIGNVVALIVLIAGMGWFFLGLRNNIAHVLAETRAGYATSKLVYTWGGGSKTTQRATRATSGRLGWNFNGVWFLKTDGSVIAAPDRAFYAPGYYPSPNVMGSYELWTGEAWAGIFRSV